ncbi:hypothetical protein Droror1_Dr00026099 [Drosera rotundifolia]
MGHGQSCTRPKLRNYNGDGNKDGLFSAIENGDVEMVRSMVERDLRSVIEVDGSRVRVTAVHVAAVSGQMQVLSMLLDLGFDPDSVNCYKQTPLIFAAMSGKISCVEKLIEAGANILLFDSLYGRTCLHYAAYFGHSDCLHAILSAAQSSAVASSWGFSRFVSIRDGNGETPLHLAASKRHAECLHILLVNGAFVGASTGTYGHPGSTPLHCAASGGSLDCVRELLAWGGDRVLQDSSGRTPYMIALKFKYLDCAALLNPLSPEPLTWPSSLKLINELNPEAKSLLEKALIEANKKREKSVLKGLEALTSPGDLDTANDCLSEDSEIELCCICFEQPCTIQVQECNHRMCAPCTLSLCCQNGKPYLLNHSLPKNPLCPFCRSAITRLVVARIENVIDDDADDETAVDMVSPRPRISRKHYSEGSCSFKGLSAMGSLGKMVGRGRTASECEEVDKT